MGCGLGEMCLIYFLQNAGFSSFPDQASCLECWDLNSRNLHYHSNPESICGLGRLGGPVAWPTHASCLLGSQGSRLHAYSGLWHLCVLCTFSPMESLMATLAAQCQFQSWAPKESSRKKEQNLAGRKEAPRNCNFQFLFSFYSFWSDSAFMMALIEAFVVLCLRHYKWYFIWHWKWNR